jgi:hypothetical protein
MSVSLELLNSDPPLGRVTAGLQLARAEIDPDHRTQHQQADKIADRRMGGTQMPSYRVCFMNEIPRNEKLFRCCQRSIIIQSARTPERAIEAAKKRFAKLEGICDWKIHAALIEIEPIDSATKPGDAPASQETRLFSHKRKTPKSALAEK